MTPDLKFFKNSKKFLIMNVIVELSGIESTGIKDY